MPDIGPLAAQIVQFLTPFLPYLLKGGKLASQEAAKALGKEFTDESWMGAKSLWKRLRPKTKIKPSVHEAIQEVATNPEDPDAQAALRLQLRKLLQSDQALVKEISHLLAQVKPLVGAVTASGSRSVAIGGNMSNSTIVTGNKNVVEQGKYNVSIGKANEVLLRGNQSQIEADTETDE